MYQFLVANEVPLPFTLHSQFPASEITLETSANKSIQCYHECLIHVLFDNENCISTETLEYLCDEV